MAAPKGNKYALGNTGGRPPHYATPEQLNQRIFEYFQLKEKHTITGLALFLGFCDLKSYNDYMDRSDEFSHIIRRARMAVMNSYEHGGQAMDIFCLKNMGWKDRSEHDVNIPQGIAISYNQQNGNDPISPD